MLNNSAVVDHHDSLILLGLLLRALEAWIVSRNWNRLVMVKAKMGESNFLVKANMDACTWQQKGQSWMHFVLVSSEAETECVVLCKSGKLNRTYTDTQQNFPGKSNRIMCFAVTRLKHLAVSAPALSFKRDS
ncbi:hypothetical protein C5167_043229 [Papaver somniferum]|uniref:Uncharacterized protein n=1 Tax=Papaver somniferum TaxID=3469 RepID=A0A4Y7L864_PAPSO|nr:hypothetical protein C5167_043229 [Papaver somniferum]